MNRREESLRGDAIRRRCAFVPVVACAVFLSFGLGACAPAGDGEKPSEQETKPAEVSMPSEGQTATSTTVSEATSDTRPPLAADYMPEIPMVADGHDGESIRKAVSDFIVQHYADRKVQSIKLMGNGVSESQAGDGMAMWASFIVSFEQGADVGLMLTCAPSLEPLIYETSRINVGTEEYYDVATGRYWHLPFHPEVEQLGGAPA